MRGFLKYRCWLRKDWQRTKTRYPWSGVKLKVMKVERKKAIMFTKVLSRWTDVTNASSSRLLLPHSLHRDTLCPPSHPRPFPLPGLVFYRGTSRRSLPLPSLPRPTLNALPPIAYPLLLFLLLSFLTLLSISSTRSLPPAPYLPPLFLLFSFASLRCLSL